MNQDVANQPAFLVFTDLDGSLMEHETYSIDAARPALQALAQRGVTPIFASSKTAAEILAIQQASEFQAPFICENGAAIFDPEVDRSKALKVFATRRNDWLPQIHAIRERLELDFMGFADWSDEEVAAQTGLTASAAMDARDREFTEPILWHDTHAKFQQFTEALAQLGLGTLEGGRFLSVQSDFDKGMAMQWWQSRCEPPLPFLVALGDSPNDASLLAAADVAVAIKSAKSDQLNPVGPRKFIRTNRPGPSGWNDAITEILALFDTGQLFTD